MGEVRLSNLLPWPHEFFSLEKNKLYYNILFPVFRIRIQLNPDPAKNLNPDQDPEDPESRPGS